MARWAAVLVLHALVAAAAAAPAPSNPKPAPESFLVWLGGDLALLGPDGKERERFERQTNARRSPDGRWIAGVGFDGKPLRSNLFVRPVGRAGDPVSVPLLWDEPGRSGCAVVWSADGMRLLICENRAGKGGELEYAHRLYELETKRITKVELPDGHTADDWSADGKRLLTTWGRERSARLAWVDPDGKGRPEFLTAADEVASSGRLSPDGRKVLYLDGQRHLYVLDLGSKKRTCVADAGIVHGYCWRADGTGVAYTWQRPLERPAEVAERETLLIVSGLDGKGRRTVARRTYTVAENSSGRSSIVFFFAVIDCR